MAQTQEEVVYPVARRVLSGGNDGLIDDRLAEENEAKKMLGELESMQPGTPDFMELLTKLRMAVLAHARSEERYEFMKLREKTDLGTLRAMAASVKAAEAFAPTHPHAGVESATANLVVGPIAAIGGPQLGHSRPSIPRTGCQLHACSSVSGSGAGVGELGAPCCPRSDVAQATPAIAPLPTATETSWMPGVMSPAA
jgi:hypothetical protein